MSTSTILHAYITVKSITHITYVPPPPTAASSGLRLRMALLGSAQTTSVTPLSGALSPNDEFVFEARFGPEWSAEAIGESLESEVLVLALEQVTSWGGRAQGPSLTVLGVWEGPAGKVLFHGGSLESRAIRRPIDITFAAPTVPSPASLAQSPAPLALPPASASLVVSAVVYSTRLATPPGNPHGRPLPTVDLPPPHIRSPRSSPRTSASASPPNNINDSAATPASPAQAAQQSPAAAPRSGRRQRPASSTKKTRRMRPTALPRVASLSRRKKRAAQPATASQGNTAAAAAAGQVLERCSHGYLARQAKYCSQCTVGGRGRRAPRASSSSAAATTLSSKGPKWRPRPKGVVRKPVDRAVKSVTSRIDLILRECDASAMDLPFADVVDDPTVDEEAVQASALRGIDILAEVHSERPGLIPDSSSLLRTHLPPSLAPPSVGGPGGSRLSNADRAAARKVVAMDLPPKYQFNSFLTSRDNPYAYYDALAKLPEHSVAMGLGSSYAEDDDGYGAPLAQPLGDDDALEDDAIAAWRAGMAVEASRIAARDPFHPDWKPVGSSSSAHAASLPRSNPPGVFPDYTHYLRNELPGE